MKKGLLIKNTFMNTAKFDELNQMFADAAMESGCILDIKTGAEVWVNLADNDYRKSDDYDFVIFWDKDIKLAEELDAEGYLVMNRAEAIADCDDKARTYLKLKRHNISQPLTICSPLKYFPDGIIDEGYIDKACKLTGFPMIIKECFGSFGQQVYLVHSREEMTETILNIGDKPYIIQKFIEGAAGHDKRLQVVGGQVVASMARENKNDFRANISNGGNMSPYTPDEEEAKLAIKVCDILGLDFAGVDILRDSDGSLYVCEVNSNAHFKNLYDCTGVNVAKEIINYAVSHNL